MLAFLYAFAVAANGAVVFLPLLLLLPHPLRSVPRWVCARRSSVVVAAWLVTWTCSLRRWGSPCSMVGGLRRPALCWPAGGMGGRGRGGGDWVAIWVGGGYVVLVWVFGVWGGGREGDRGVLVSLSSPNSSAYVVSLLRWMANHIVVI
jgi:hypothetical protein